MLSVKVSHSVRESIRFSREIETGTISTDVATGKDPKVTPSQVMHMPFASDNTYYVVGLASGRVMLNSPEPVIAFPAQQIPLSAVVVLFPPMSSS